MAENEGPDPTVGEIRARVERIERTRARMGDTIEEIGAHLNPQHLKHEFQAGVREQVEQTKREIRGATIGRAETMIHNVEETVNHTSRTLMDTIRDNPVPAAMAGIGLGWLITDARRHQTHHDAYYGDRERDWGGIASTEPGYVGAYGYTAPPMTRTERMQAEAARARGTARHEAEHTADRARHAASNAADEARDMADRAQDTVSDAAHRARQGASNLADRVEDTVEDAWHGAEDAWHDAEARARRAQYRASRVADENPLATGAVALALGFAAGMMVRETQPERRMMGPTRDRLVHRAREAAVDAADRVGDMVEGAPGKVVREAAKRAVGNEESGSGDSVHAT